MKLYQKIIVYGATIACLGGLLSGITGCSEEEENIEGRLKNETKTEQTLSKSFAEVPMYSESGIAITSGDFDGDGDLDIIVGTFSSDRWNGKLYLFLNDGGGNFSVKETLNPIYLDK